MEDGILQELGIEQDNLKDYEKNQENLILTNMILHTEYLSMIREYYKPSYFRLDFARVISSWCIEYFDKYKAAPISNIKDIYFAREAQVEEKLYLLVGEYLKRLSAMYNYEEREDFNLDVAIDQTLDYFNWVRADKANEAYLDLAESGQSEDAIKTMTEFQKLERVDSSSIDICPDPDTDTKQFERIKTIADKKIDQLFKFTGDLGKLVGWVGKGFLVSFLAPATMGKTWWLLETAMQARSQGLNVLFVSLEMSMEQMVMRALNRLHFRCDKEYEGVIRLPVFDCEHNQTNECQDTCDVGLGDNFDDEDEDNGDDGGFKMPDPEKDWDDNYIPCDKCARKNATSKMKKKYKFASWFKKVTIQQLDKSRLAMLSRKRNRKIMRRPKPGKLIITEFPSGSLTMPMLEATKNRLESEYGLEFQLVVTDYADKCRAVVPGKTIEKLQEIWEGHKALAQKYKCAVFTASQSNTARDKKKAGSGNWADHIGKLNLIDIGIGIHMEPSDKKRGLYQMTMLKHRHAAFDENITVVTRKCLKIGQTCLSSRNIGYSFAPKKKGKK